jgi:very-short-patch-repair endonuclease
MPAKKWRTDSARWRRIKHAVRTMRAEPTRALLWDKLRRAELRGIRFRRQHPIGRFVADFYCPRAKLVVEVDGSIHDGREEADEQRDQLMIASGYAVLRFKNEQVLGDADAVVQAITRRLDELLKQSES